MSTNRAQLSRIGTPVAWSLAGFAAGALTIFAFIAATDPPTVQLPGSTPVTIAVTEGSVSLEQAYGIDVEWPAVDVGVSSASGTVTSIAIGQESTVISSGDVVYAIGLEPVVAIEGSTPFFRDLARGAEGDDVRQVQRHLISAGFLSGDADGVYGPSTALAVESMRAALNVPIRQTVLAGDFIAIPKLPAVVAPTESLRVGARVSPGDSLLITPASPEPMVSFRVLPEAIGRTAKGLSVVIEHDGHEWLAEVDRLAASDDELGGTVALLRPSAGKASICAPECANFARVGASAVLPGRLILIPETRGAQVPTSAISTDAQGQPHVTTADGNPTPVTVLASSGGRSIVEGVEIGEEILVSTSSASDSEN